MAEALLRARLAERAPGVVVGSAGLRFDGHPAERNAVKAMAKRGIDLSGFSSHILSAPFLEGASVILAMEQMHVREVAMMGDALFARTFTLPEFVELAEAHGPRLSGTLEQWVLPMGAGRSPQQYLGTDPSREVRDPIGQSARAFRSCAAELDGLLDRLVDLAWPLPAPAGDPHPETPQPGGIHADRDRL